MKGGPKFGRNCPLLKLEPLIVGIFAILPGFLSAAVRSILVSGKGTTTAEWTVTSIVTSLFLNAFALTVWFLIIGQAVDLSKSVGEIGTQVSAAPASMVAIYLAVLYGFALVWGAVSGLARQYSPRHIAFLTRLTPISPEPDVFHLALGERFRTKKNLAKRGQNDQQVPWLKLHSDTGVILGRLRSSSVKIERDKPFEVYLEPAYTVENGVLTPIDREDGAEFVGLYVRLKPENTLKVFTARADWVPDATYTQG